MAVAFQCCEWSYGCELGYWVIYLPLRLHHGQVARRVLRDSEVQRLETDGGQLYPPAEICDSRLMCFCWLGDQTDPSARVAIEKVGLPPGQTAHEQISPTADDELT
jgi:hypothetical protein